MKCQFTNFKKLEIYLDRLASANKQGPLKVLFQKHKSQVSSEENSDGELSRMSIQTKMYQIMEQKYNKKSVNETLTDLKEEEDEKATKKSLMAKLRKIKTIQDDIEKEEEAERSVVDDQSISGFSDETPHISRFMSTTSPTRFQSSHLVHQPIQEHS